MVCEFWASETCCSCPSEYCCCTFQLLIWENTNYNLKNKCMLHLLNISNQFSLWRYQFMSFYYIWTSMTFYLPEYIFLFRYNGEKNTLMLIWLSGYIFNSPSLVNCFPEYKSIRATQWFFCLSTKKCFRFFLIQNFWCAVCELFVFVSL